MGTHPIFESDFDCLTGVMLSLCKLLKSVKIQPTNVLPIGTRFLTVSNPVESRIAKKWTQRRMKRHAYERIARQRAEEFEASQQFRYEKQISRQKSYVDNVWRGYGLKSAPPPLSIEQKEKLIEKYVEQGVFNEPLSAREIHAHSVGSPTRVDFWQKNKRRMYRKAYKGIQNPIPLDRMINPLTGEKLKSGTIRKYQTKRYLWEKRQKAEMGALAHDRYRHSHGWVSLRDCLELKHIERGMPLPKWTAKKPSTLPQLNRSQWMMGKKKHYHVLNGYYDEDFVTPWRHFALKTHHDVHASGLADLPVRNKHYMHGWSNPENFKLHEIGAMQRTRKSKHTRKLEHLAQWRKGKPYPE